MELRVADVYSPSTSVNVTLLDAYKKLEMMVDFKRTTRLAIALFLAIALVWAPGVGAQGPPDDPPGNGPPFDDPDHPCYPDGCGPGPTTTAPPAGPSCGIALETSIVDAEVTATVRNVPAGGTVRLLFAGREVARATNNGGVQSIRAMPAQAADLTMTFTVPDLPPGVYTVVAVGDTFTVTCTGNGFSIQGVAGSGGDRDGNGNGDGGGGALAFTGASILGLVLLGLALLAIGYYLVRRNRSARAQ